MYVGTHVNSGCCGKSGTQRAHSWPHITPGTSCHSKSKFTKTSGGMGIRGIDEIRMSRNQYITLGLIISFSPCFIQIF